MRETESFVGNRVGLGNYQVCQLTVVHVFPFFPRILDVDMKTYGHFHLDDIAFSVQSRTLRPQGSACVTATSQSDKLGSVTTAHDHLFRNMRSSQ